MGMDICRCFAIFTDKLAFLSIFVISLTLSGVWSQSRSSPCYDPNGKPQRCMPEFGNAAYLRPVESTNTCGNPRIRYCLQTGATGATQSCSNCDAADKKLSHRPELLTDFNNQINDTWWQSETMNEGMQFPTKVNLTLRLGKKYEITYVRLKFYSKRPESFAIYKRTASDSDWVAWQYYSASCRRTYGVPFEQIIRRDNEHLAICTADYSDISPLTGGNVAFSTLEGRPGGYQFEQSIVLQEWVTASDIRIVLTRMNTFGDEVFGDETVLQSYFYAISDLSVGGRCKCNGHANECVYRPGFDHIICKCEHNTAGPDCDECLPFYNDRPWARSTSTLGNECMPCECNSLSNSCYFDEVQYKRTGRGGHCTNCTDNADGPHCENCKNGFYRKQPENRCFDCKCDPTGSLSLQCDDNGRCRCKTGVTGDKCDRCASNHYDFGPTGCRQCECLVAGSEENDPRCLPNTGTCVCKEFVEGQNCDRCKPGYFALEENHPQGCISCFCYGHSSICASSPGYVTKSLSSSFDRGDEGWRILDAAGNERGVVYRDGSITASTLDDSVVYFSAPARFLGDQKSSYNLLITFKIKIDQDGSRASRRDLVLQSGDTETTIPIFGQRNQIPKSSYVTYTFRLNEHEAYQWKPRLNAVQFIGVLANLTAIHIRASYTPEGSGTLDDFKMEIGGRTSNGGEKTTNVEECTCPEGYVGQFCESCASGYHRDPPYGGPYARCVPCKCNGHSQSCVKESGRCLCQDNTMGENCERCAAGFYGNALAGTPEDCKPCPCPGQGPCVLLDNSDVACTECPRGYGGLKCDKCVDGYYGDPEGRMTGIKSSCKTCKCNENIDPNAIFNCKGTSGKCLKCIYNTAGFSCDKCLPGHYGDPLKIPRGDCKDCECHPPGTFETETDVMQCHLSSGKCPCKRNVIGQKCDQCQPGYWGLDSGRGCRACDCDLDGSFNATCDLYSGQCYCKPGVTGMKCNRCLPSYYGFSDAGCKACNCDPVGAYSLQCGDNGQCPCLPNIVGKQCDSCQENKYNISAGCVACPKCYNLVQEQVNIQREKMKQLRDLLDNIGENPQEVDDSEFREKLKQTNDSVVALYKDALNSMGTDVPLVDEIRRIKESIDTLQKKCGDLDMKATMADDNVDMARDKMVEAKRLIDIITKMLDEAEKRINTEGREALKRAENAQKEEDQQSSRLTKIAKMARELSVKQKTDALEVEKKAEEVLNTTKECYNKARDVLGRPRQTLQDVAKLERNLTDIEGIYNKTVKMSQDVSDDATDTYKRILDDYSRADSIQLPEMDIDKLKNQSRKLKEKADNLVEMSNNQTRDNQELRKKVDMQLYDGEDVLKQAIAAQQKTDELLADVDFAKSVAVNAILSGETTLKKANETLKTLQGFDRRIVESKSKAEDALKEIPEIEARIQEAEENTKKAQDSLSGAENDATQSLELALKAKKNAEFSAENATQMETDTQKGLNDSLKLRDRADQLHGQAFDYLDEIIKLEKKANADEILIKDASDKAMEAKRQAALTSAKVKTTQDAVINIITDMDNTGMVDMDRLEGLEKLFNEVDKLVIDAKLEQRFISLMDMRDRHLKTVDSFDADLEELRLDVDNVQEIRDKLPKGCFKQLALEKTEP